MICILYIIKLSFSNLTLTRDQSEFSKQLEKATQCEEYSQTLLNTIDQMKSEFRKQLEKTTQCEETSQTLLNTINQMKSDSNRCSKEKNELHIWNTNLGWAVLILSAFVLTCAIISCCSKNLKIF